MAKQSTIPAGLARYNPMPEDHNGALFHVYGLSIGGEVLTLGHWRDGLEPVEAMGLPAVRVVVSQRRKGWDIAGEWSTHEDDCGDRECRVCYAETEAELMHHIPLPHLVQVQYWRVVNVDANTEELWVNTADGPLPLSMLV